MHSCTIACGFSTVYIWVWDIQPTQVRFLVVCLVLGQVIHPVVFPALLLVLHKVGVLSFTKNGLGYGNISWFILPLHCMVAPILHNKCSKNQLKGILNADLHHRMWVFHCILGVLNFAKKLARVWKYFLVFLAFTLYGCSYIPKQTQ